MAPSLVYSDSYDSNGIDIANLAEDFQHVSYYGSGRLDIGGNAKITTTKPLLKLTVASEDIKQKIHLLGIDISGVVQLSNGLENGSIVSVRGVPVGTIDRSGVKDENPQYGFTITFNPGATNAQAEEIIWALNYTNDGPAIDAGREIDHLIIDINLTGADGTYCNTHVFMTVAPPNVKPLTYLNDIFDGTDGDDFYAATYGMFGFGDIIDGGAGTDTLQLVSGFGEAGWENTFQLSLLGALRNVEIIQGTSDKDIITVSEEQLEDVQIIYGGGEGSDRLRIDGANMDLRGKIILDFASIEVMQSNATVIVDSKDLAFLVTSTRSNTTLILKGHALESWEKELLEANGITTIIDDAEAYPLPNIENLGDAIMAEFGKTVLLDAGSDAILINGHDDPMFLWFSIENVTTVNDVLGISTDGTGIYLSKNTENGSVISVGTKEIGYISDAEGGYFEFSFYGEATNADVQALLRALTYTNTSTSSASATYKDIVIFFQDREEHLSHVNIRVDVGPPSPTIANLNGDSIKVRAGTIGTYLDRNSDAVVADGDENISHLTVRVKAHNADDLLEIHNSVAGGIRVDGWVVKPGAKIFLGLTEIGTFTADTTNHFLDIAFVDGVTAAQVQELIRVIRYWNTNTNGNHTGTRDIEITLTDKAGGSVTQEVDVVIGPPTPPEISNIDGDIVDTSAGTTVFIDEDSNAVVTHGDGTEFLGLQITVAVASATDHLGIDVGAGNIELSDGLKPGSKVSVYSSGVKIEIGELTAFTTQDTLSFIFNGNATTALVQELLRAVTYRSSAAAETVAEKVILITLFDDNDAVVEAFTKVNLSPTPTNDAPDVAVDTGRETTSAIDTGPLVNPFGGLVFTDDENDVLTVRISLDASHGRLVVPAGLAMPGFEEKDGKKIYTFTGRPDALAVIMDVLQFDAAERPLAAAGSKHVTEFTISVTDTSHPVPDRTVVYVESTVANRAPTEITLSKSTVSEIVGGEVGTLSATDQDGASFTYELVDNAGGRFVLDASGKKVIATNGLLLDHEQAVTHTIRVKVSDGKGGVFEKALTINVTDRNPENILGSSGDDVFVGGASNDTIDGSSGNDKITGGAGSDSLLGGTGNDTLSSGLGNDILRGGAGKDTFVFDTRAHAKTNKDKILDWVAKDDVIHLENKVFTALKKMGALKKGNFALGAKAGDKDDFVGYDKKTGDLWYDSNGNKSGGQVLFAHIGKNKKIAFNDFFVI